MEPTEIDTAVTQRSLDELIAAIDIELGDFPEQALRELQRRPEEATPRLIELLRKGVATIRAGQEVVTDGHFFAFFC